MKRLVAFIIVFFCVALSLSAQDTIFLSQTCIVQMEDTLVIEPNTVVVTRGGIGFHIIGTVIARGTEEEPITFTTFFDAAQPNATSWRGIEFDCTDNNPIADTSVFEHCIFEYSHAYANCSDNGIGGVVVANISSKVRFSDCIFRNNYANYAGGVMYLNQSGITIERCTFEDNYTNQETNSFAGAIYCSESPVKLRNSIIKNCSSSSVGGGLFISSSDGAEIVNNEFTQNVGSTGGAAFITGCNDIIFSGNLFHNNIGSFFGGALGLKNSTFTIVNCTIANNFGGQAGGIYCSSGVTMSVYNSIFSHNITGANGPQIYIAYAESVLHFFNCAIEGGKYNFGGAGGGLAYHGQYDSNVEDTLSFISCSGYDYCLPDDSPCIDAGSSRPANMFTEYDIKGDDRIIGDAIDMGALEYKNSVGISESGSDNVSLGIFPNPAQNYIYVDSSSPVVIYDLNGKQVKVSHDNSRIDISNLPDGLYIIRTYDVSNRAIRGKFVVSR